MTEFRAIWAHLCWIARDPWPPGPANPPTARERLGDSSLGRLNSAGVRGQAGLAPSPSQQLGHTGAAARAGHCLHSAEASSVAQRQAGAGQLPTGVLRPSPWAQEARLGAGGGTGRAALAFPSARDSRRGPAPPGAGWTPACPGEAPNQCLSACLACTGSFASRRSCISTHQLLCCCSADLLPSPAGSGERAKSCAGPSCCLALTHRLWPSSSTMKIPSGSAAGCGRGSRSFSSHLYTSLAHGSEPKQCRGDTASPSQHTGRCRQLRLCLTRVLPAQPGTLGRVPQRLKASPHLLSAWL